MVKHSPPQNLIFRAFCLITLNNRVARFNKQEMDSRFRFRFTTQVQIGRLSSHYCYIVDTGVYHYHT